jgi:hypothetical protein
LQRCSVGEARIPGRPLAADFLPVAMDSKPPKAAGGQTSRKWVASTFCAESLAQLSLASSKSRFSLGYVAVTATPSRLDNGLQDYKERYRALPSHLNAIAMSPNSS